MPNVNVNDIIDARKGLFELQKEYFIEHVLFAPQWWFLVLITVVLWITWIILVDKRRISTILLVGFITSLLAVIMDDIGLSLTLWGYPYPLSPFVSRLNPVDVAVIPVSYMLLYQYAKKWRAYFILLVLLALFAIFVSEPIFSMLNMYILLGWEYWYSGPIYIMMGIFVKWLVDKIKKQENIYADTLDR